MTARSLDVGRRVAIARLQGQGLVTPAHVRPADVVRALCAVQSQDYAGAKWALGMRATGLADSDIDEACDRGEILRTHVLRPTWHFVAPEDLRWMQRLTGERVRRMLSTYDVRLGIDAAALKKSRRVIEKALAVHGQRTRAELKPELDAAGVHTEGTQRLAHLVMHLELDAMICSGSRAGKQSTYALLESRAPVQRDLTGDEALHELTRRYFASRAPATPHDFAWWSGLTMGESRRGIAMVDTLAPVALGDTTYWAPAGFALPEHAPGLAHLLPNYDEFFIGFRDRSAIGRRLKDLALVTGGNALIAHVVTVDGQLVGRWKRADVTREAEATLDLLVSLTKAERAMVERCADAFRTFVSASAVTARPLSARTPGAP